MAGDLRRLLDWPIDDVVAAYDERDAIRYALALGLGGNPLDAGEISYVYERDLAVLPSFATVLADPGFWLADPRLGLDWPRMLHGAQAMTVHRALPPAGRVRTRSRVVTVRDRGAGKGSVIVTRRELRDAGSDALWCELEMTSLLRGDGASGSHAPTGATPARPAASAGTETAATVAVPPSRRPPDATVIRRTLPQAALLYRQCGDRNPLHADPDVARAAGYPRPILHGLATYGIACHALLTALDAPPRRLDRFDARFTAPVYPGETIRIEAWIEAAGATFEAHVVERGVKVLGHGRASLINE